MSEWTRKTIAQCAADEPYSTQIGPFGKALTPQEYTSSGVPLLRGVNVNSGRFYDDGFVFISEETADRLSKFESFPGDVLLVHKGTLGQIGLMPKNRKFDRYIMGNSMLRVKCDPEKLLPEYLYYWLSSSEGQHYLFSRVSQVGVPQIQQPLTTLRQASLPVPPLYEQKAITNILGSLDDKIELNRQMNETLEAMARAIFKDWFIDFGPTRAKMAGRPPYLPGQVWSLFPDTIDEETGLPQGWNVGNILEFADLLSGGTPKTSEPSYWDGDIDWVSAKDVKNANGSFLLETEKKITQTGIDKSSTKLLPPKTTIITARGTVGEHRILGRPMTMNQTNYGLKAKDHFGDYFIYFMLKNLIEELRQQSYGTIFDTITTKTFLNTTCTKPSKMMVQKFEDQVVPFMDTVLCNQVISSTLAELRDRLLPRLMSGEIRVKEAEKMVEEVM
ncbi:restriction endonuclease subunit S [Synechococcus sp. PCC 6312]|uniref:restriction endonuclease subunit S n=1 Tax=Synechococcus sp. (strain ATCC 27167 / PCC 6312) TaxID=195253 RepID=UPI00029F2D83|nr:restriction endonuclease subunit S [Synechococcus sp. PCC 6312]AFY60094.1 restriction endonuclease S subunit [Synechococcus sp. PCC 6312]